MAAASPRSAAVPATASLAMLSPWFEQMATLPPGQTLPSPQDLYDPQRATLLIKQGHPVDRSLLEKLRQFGLTPDRTPPADVNKRMALPDTLQSSRASHPGALGRLERKVLVVEPDGRCCRKILSQLITAQIVSPQRLVTIPAVSLLERALTQVRPTDLILSWQLQTPAIDEDALWPLLKNLQHQHPGVSVMIVASCTQAHRSQLSQWEDRVSNNRANFLLKPLAPGALAAIMG